MRNPSSGNEVPADAAQKVDGGVDARDSRADAGNARAKISSTVKGRPAPRLPHERDESSDSGTGAPSEAMRRAHDDAASGKPATDRGEATDAVYRRSLRGKTPGAERD